MFVFEWDENKAGSNLKKHGVSFEEAQSVFMDENARIIPDPEHSDDEDRFILLGISANIRILTVCHCYRQDEKTVRIISARKATSREAKQYQEFL
ncbi:BrnT family toxin [bacterium]|nr:BrnT family toxin [bacterium]